MRKNRTYNGKTVIWESKLKQVGVIIICFFFSGIALFLYDYSTFKFWATILLFGLGGIFMLVRFVNTNNMFVKPSSELGKKIISDWFIEDQDDLGFFSYTKNGFTEPLQNIQMNWEEVEAIFAYKKDLWIVDNICLDIFSKNKSIHLNESTLGWYQFVERMEINLDIKPSWMMNVAETAFKENFTLIFDKNQRSQSEIIKEFYGKKPIIRS